MVYVLIRNHSINTKNHNMKKLLLVLAIGAFAACNNSSTDAKASADSSKMSADSSKMAADSSKMAMDSTKKMVDSAKKDSTKK
jgi:uncharacterized lipoprotein YajG